MSEYPVDISVIVPCRNEEKHIKKAIKRIINQKGAGQLFNYELLIVDGKSNDKTINIIGEEVKKNNKIKLIINENRTTPFAFNLGIRTALGKYICILGAHAEIEKNYLLSCLETIESTDADNVGGPWKAKGYGYVGEAIAIAFQNSFAIGGAKGHSLHYEGYVDTVWGGFYKKEVFDNIGLFDEELIRNQDDEFNYRLVKSGGKIWQTPRIKYFYHCRNNIKSLFHQYLQYGCWKIRVIQKHKMPASIRHLIPGIFVTVLLVSVVLSFISSIGLKVFLGLILLYFSVAFLVSCLTCVKQRRIKFLPIMPIVFATFHFGYGIGFLKGFMNFIVLRKHKKEEIVDVSLTR